MSAPVSTAPAHLLVVDEDGVRATLTSSMEFLGFRVTGAATGRQALEVLSRHRPDLVLLDVNLPGIDGFEVCRTMRTRGHTMPVMFLTGRDEVDERVRGLDLGGDDFVTKPFELKELAARVRALLRRTSVPPAERHRLRAGGIRLDADTYEVWSAERPVRLTTTEFALLRYLMENPGRVLTRVQIQERVWHHRTEGSGSVDTYVYYLRRKLGDPGQALIRTVRGTGYLLATD
ncbi:response regulator transcription factor [Streptomyces sp. NBC_00878]|uniref:response regulator transcription factor n=1 Tax=Streptomyces sp. NBC_00878 TaxID=2975854 RepID=UPI002251A633|nr:response regulator transcription factor [Streptomyces sp. NBC_00878]MCX4907288.1 response regulator transcription factor [Streptomyces sp. NBC_00878]